MGWAVHHWRSLNYVAAFYSYGSVSLILSSLLCSVVSSAPCNATWTVYVTSNMFSGSRLSTANSVTTCLQGCKTNVRCRGVDYNAANPVGWRCFLHFSSAAVINMGVTAGVTHYSISRLCPGTIKLPFCAWDTDSIVTVLYRMLECLYHLFKVRFLCLHSPMYAIPPVFCFSSQSAHDEQWSKWGGTRRF